MPRACGLSPLAHCIPVFDSARRYRVSLIVASALFMENLDSTIILTALPEIARSLNAEILHLNLAVTAYLLSLAVFIPLSGWVADRFGSRNVFRLAIGVFTLASVLCAAADSAAMLVAARVLQGMGGAMMSPVGRLIILRSVPKSELVPALAYLTIPALIGPVLGPPLGGFISTYFSWHWIFLINVPIGLLVTFLCWNGLAGRETPTAKLPIDGVGLGLLVIWAGALQVMLDTGKNADWFASTQIVVLGIVAVIGFVAFVIWELTEEHPIVDLSLFKSRNFAIGTIVFCLGNGVFLANMLLMPLWLQTHMGYTATWAGLVTAPTGVVAVLLTPAAARAMGRMDARWIASVSFLASAFSYYLRAGLTADASFWAIALPLMVQGIANATFFIAVVSLLMDDVPQARIPSASGLSNFARIIAAGFSVSIVTTLWDRREALHQSRLADFTTGYAPVFNQALSAMQGLGFSDLAGKAALTQEMVGQAYLLASIDIFHLSVWLCLVAVALIWLCHRVRVAARG